MGQPYHVECYNPIQIIPCEPGWTVHYWDNDRKTIEAWSEPVAMWALCEWVTEIRADGDLVREERQRNVICGVTVSGGEGMEICETASNFAGYKSPAMSLDEFKRRVGAAELTEK